MIRILSLMIFLVWTSLLAPVFAADLAPWDDPVLVTPPKVEWTDPIGPDFTAVYENVPYKGKMARVLAYYSVPASYTGKLPVMVLVHGGAGMAFPQWTKQWASYGYAAIAMDLGGATTPSPDGRPWDSDNFNVVGTIPDKDTWYYHAAAAVIRAISLVAARPEVDTTRIGIMGISWGGFLTSIVSGVDKRLALAVPVYGCGYIQEVSYWAPITNQAYLSKFDPALYLPNATLPMLWLNGPSDITYPMIIHRKSYRLPQGPVTVSIHNPLPHDYNSAWGLTEPRAFVDSYFKGGKALPKIKTWGWDKTSSWATYESPTTIIKAELIYTTDAEPWKNFKTLIWQAQAATVLTNENRVQAKVPANATVHYLALTDSRNLLVSSQHVDLTLDSASGTRTTDIPVSVSGRSAKRHRTAHKAKIGGLSGDFDFIGRRFPAPMIRP